MSTNTKKKFKDTQVGQFLLNKIPNVVEAVAGNSLAGNVIQAIIGGSEMSDEDGYYLFEKTFSLYQLLIQNHAY